MPSTQLLTYQDVLDHSLDYLGGATDPANERKCRRAIQNAVSEYWSKRTWAYAMRQGRVITQPSYSTGTITYVASTLLVTLAGGTWPSWAADGTLVISQVTYPVASRVSDTVLKLQSSLAGISDITTPTAYQLAQMDYPLPVDFGSAGEVVMLQFARQMTWYDPDRFLQLRRVYSTPAAPYAYTIQWDSRRYGSLVLSLFPGPDTTYNLDFSYQRQGRPLSMHGLTPVVAYSTGKATVSSASATVTGTGTAWTSDMVNCIMRFSAQSSGQVPTGQGGSYPFYVQRVVADVPNSTTITLDQAPGVTLSSVPHSISDPVDIEMGAMLGYFLREIEKQVRIICSKESNKDEAVEYMRALRSAFEADSRHHESRSSYGTPINAVRIANMPQGSPIGV